jgi:hypothetical protein
MLYQGSFVLDGNEFIPANPRAATVNVFPAFLEADSENLKLK